MATYEWRQRAWEPEMAAHPVAWGSMQGLPAGMDGSERDAHLLRALVVGVNEAGRQRMRAHEDAALDLCI